MPVTVTEIEELRAYIAGVMGRADHHAENVNEIALALVGAIVWRKDDDAPIRVLAQNGETKNVLWTTVGGRRYAFSYNHSEGAIEMREGGTQGRPLHRFSNATALSEVRNIFEQLWSRRDIPRPRPCHVRFFGDVCLTLLFPRL